VAGAVALLGDVGGTHARFALLCADGTIAPAVDLPSAAYRELATPARESLSRSAGTLSLPAAPALRSAAIAVAGPVTGDEVELTNVSWRFSIEATRRALGLDRLLVLNDLAALAWAVPVLERRESAARVEGAGEGGEVAGSAAVSAVVAVGTGLGVATHVRSGAAEVVLASEGGHRDLAATTAREWAVVERLRARFGEHVSVERAVSGLGLANLYRALAEVEGEGAGAAAGEIAPEEVTRRAAAGEARAGAALALFSGWLGAFAGDLALTAGARAGVWLGGGVLAALGGLFDAGAFARRFVAKGRFAAWLSAVPVRTFGEPRAAFFGLARALAAG
jgi:glucokinase